jgi:DNA-binding GntR family transcriptional regulator
MGEAAVTAVGEIADRLRRDIVDGAIGLGDRLKLEALAQRYSTGHMPVREALRQLAGEGLVEIAPNRGARVREVDLEFVHNLFDLRIVIEALIARRCAERIDAPQLAALEAAQAHYEAVARRRDYQALVAANRAFHEVMSRAARNPEAEAMLERHWRLIAALWNRFGYGASRVASVIADHHQIIRALRARDPEVASCLAMAHTAKAKQELVARMLAAAPGERP